ncbi:alpha/beta hydrolase [Olivibacter sp. SDN3]|uniref:alpha/beta fold hydrolase n=1 Tax=Olivibacter sp. SDN3 TaxID=2764720 RepID=UPI00165114EA|nr:alpha/beta hydrolase [Olivibacter sp. SDN3]QNL51871.1 alpha/beta hydrolase [Olivibacter sp. SDN3]
MKEIQYSGNDGLPLFAVSLESKSNTPKSTLIFLHGGGPDHHSLLPLAKSFQGAYTAILPDLRGYGRSICRDRNCYTWRQYADDLVYLIDTIETESIIVIAAGIGTTISLKTALRFPDKIHGLVLISIEDIENDEGKKREIELLEAFAACVVSDGIEAAWEPLLSFLSPVIGHMVRDAIPRSDPASIVAAASIVYDRAFDNFEDLKGITIPTLIIPGDDDRHPAALAKSIAKSLVNGHLSDVTLSKDIMTINDFSKTFAPTIQQFLNNFQKTHQ